MTPFSTSRPSVKDLWSVPVPVTEIPPAGLHRNLEADAQARARVAAAAGLRDVSRLSAQFELVPLSGDRVRVTGRLSAVVGQTCVVTLEPLDSVVEERIDVVFSPDAEDPDPEPETDDLDRHGSWENDPPEPLENGLIDLGNVAVEFLILGIDPYPRKEGVAFDAPKDPHEAAAHPFAALARLKGKDKPPGEAG